MMIAFATVAAVAAVIPQMPARSPGDFDLAHVSGRKLARDRAVPPAPVIPSNMDTRDFAVDAPEFELPLADKGPVILVGAMGGRHSGMPKLAHVALGWSF